MPELSYFLSIFFSFFLKYHYAFSLLLMDFSRFFFLISAMDLFLTIIYTMLYIQVLGRVTYGNR